MYRSFRRVLLVAGLLALLSALLNPAVAALRTRSVLSGSSAPSWAPAATASIRPGVQTFSEGAQCTANFVFTDSAGAVYLGQAAHCSGTGGPTETNGCNSGSLRLGTPVKIEGASKPGTLVYNSWITMQAKGETDPNACQYNDFALVKIDAADVGKVNPSVPFFGGPVGLASAGTAVGDAVYSYGNSKLRLGLSVLSPKRGVSIGDGGDGWSHLVYTVSPGIPGDSGSGVLDKAGRALGVLSTVQVLPLAGSNGVGDLPRELAYLKANSGLPAVTLAEGTEAFTPGRIL